MIVAPDGTRWYFSNDGDGTLYIRCAQQQQTFEVENDMSKPAAEYQFKVRDLADVDFNSIQRALGDNDLATVVYRLDASYGARIVLSGSFAPRVRATREFTLLSSVAIGNECRAFSVPCVWPGEVGSKQDVQRAAAVLADKIIGAVRQHEMKTVYVRQYKA